MVKITQIHNKMALSEATLKAIQRAQNSLAKPTFSTAASAFNTSYEKAYKAQIEANKREEERIEKNRIDSLKNRDILMANGESLGYFTNIGASILNDFADQYADTHKLSQYEGQIAQRNINREAQVKLKPYAEAAQLQMETIDSVEKGILDKSLKNIKDEKTKLSHYTILEGIAKTNEVYEDGFIIDVEEIDEKRNKKNKKVKIPFEDVPELKNIDAGMLDDYNSGINELIRTARTENMPPSSVESMVKDFVMNLDQNAQQNVLANYHSVITDNLSQYQGNEPALSNLLEQRIITTINNRYQYEPPKIEEPEKLKSGEAYYNAAIKSIDELPNSINPSALKMSSKKDYYLSTLFTNKLPEGYVSSGEFDEDGDLIIQNANNNKQILIKENEPLSAVKAKLKSIATGRSRFFTE